MRAKFYCQSLTRYEKQVIAELHAVTSGSEENRSFAQYTPNAHLKITIDNPAVLDYFKPGGEYYLDFSEAPK